MASRLLRRLGEKGAQCCTSCLTSCCLTSYRFGSLPLHCHLLRAAGDRGMQCCVSTLDEGTLKLQEAGHRAQAMAIWLGRGPSAHFYHHADADCPADPGTPP